MTEPDTPLVQHNSVMGPAWPLCGWCPEEATIFYSSSRMTPRGFAACSRHRELAAAQRDRAMTQLGRLEMETKA